MKIPTIAPHDTVNAGLELIGAWMVSKDVRALYAAKRSVGRSFQPMLFFTTWGLCNLWVYPASQLYASAVAGAVLAAMNVALVVLFLRYRTKGHA